MRHKKGFTIAEVIVASVLVVIIAAVAYNFYVLAKDAWFHVFAQGDMQTEAILGIEKMLYGVDATRKGVLEAQDIITPGDGTTTSVLRFVDQDDININRFFSKQADTLVYTNENGINTVIINGDVQTLTFTRPAGQPDIVDINLVLQRAIRGKVITVNLSTSARIRNI
ncbi:MAG: prepilin-type N-terminal cleavage/methylation domain-containing protein [Candidatus Omnitrophota bacterium]